MVPPCRLARPRIRELPRSSKKQGAAAHHTNREASRLRPGRVPCPAVADLNPGGGFRLVSNIGAASALPLIADLRRKDRHF
jgi:hypothetical protein